MNSHLVFNWALQHGYLFDSFDNSYIYTCTTMDQYLVFNWALQHGYIFGPYDNLYIYTCTTMDQYLVFNWALQHGYLLIRMIIYTFIHVQQWINI